MKKIKSILLLTFLFGVSSLSAQTASSGSGDVSEAAAASKKGDPCWCKDVSWNSDSTTIVIRNISQIAKDQVGHPKPTMKDVVGCYKNVHSGWHCDECTFTEWVCTGSVCAYEKGEGECETKSLGDTSGSTSSPPSKL